jgi:hypothetical protein
MRGLVPRIPVFAAAKTWMVGPSPIRANLRRIINLSVVIVRACGRSGNHGKSGFGTAVAQPALRGLLGAPLEAGHDNSRGLTASFCACRVTWLAKWTG